MSRPQNEEAEAVERQAMHDDRRTVALVETVLLAQAGAWQVRLVGEQRPSSSAAMVSVRARG